MNIGYRVEMTLDELNTLITACSVRLQELSNLYEREKGCYSAHVLREYDKLFQVRAALENAEFFANVGGVENVRRV